MVGKTFLRNFATWKSCLGEVLDLLHWCEEVDEDTSQQVEDLLQTIDIFCTGFRTSLVAGGG